MKAVTVFGYQYKYRPNWQDSSFFLNDEPYIPQNEEVVFDSTKVTVYKFEAILECGDTLWETHYDPITRRNLSRIYTVESPDSQEIIQNLLSDFYDDMGWAFHLDVMKAEEREIEESDYDSLVNSWERDYWEWKRRISR